MSLGPGDAHAPSGDISVFGVTHLPADAPKKHDNTVGPASFGIVCGVPPPDSLLSGPDMWRERRVEKKEGVLAKRGGGTSLLGSQSFAERWFVVRDGRFRYYDLNSTRNGPSDPTKAKKGRNVEIPYFQVARDPKYRKCFYLIPIEETLRVWALKAPTADEAADWCAALVTNGAAITERIPQGLGED